MTPNQTITPVRSYGNEEAQGLTRERSAPLAISFPLLLAVYGLIPLAVVVILVDVCLLGSRLKAALPASPYDWWIVTALFNYPHIFASQFSLMDREYLPRYRRLLWGVPAVILAALVLAIFINPYGFAIFELVTIIHVILQQVGITRLMMGPVPTSFAVWKWLFVGAFAFAYVGLALEARFWVLVLAVGPLLIPTTYLAYRAAAESKTPIGRHYLLSNQTMLLFTAACYPLGYPVFSILIPRVIHDVTAFFFYVTHDYNRNREEIKNSFYRLFRILPMPLAFVGPFVALSLNVLLRTFTRLAANPFFFAPVNMIHYYTEKFIWRRDTIHRQSLVFRS